MAKKKIAVLGGGMSALASIYELTKQPNWQDQYDITLYQMGWRVGGKTCTGRGTNQRVEEVGIHILQGWYKKVFKLLDESYQYCHEHKLFLPDFPCERWQDAFERENATLLTQWFEPKGKWISKNLIFPENNIDPTDDTPEPPFIMVDKMFQILRQVFLGLPPATSSWTSNLFNTWVGDVFEQISTQIQQAPRNPKLYKLIIQLLQQCQKGFVFFCECFPEDSEYIYWIRTIGEFALVAFRGFLEDIYDIETETINLENINHLDFREWLRQKGLSEIAVQSAMVRFAYTGTFANLAGGEGSIGAGAAMGFMLEAINYKGSFVWKFKAGTGDTLVAPIFMMLKHKGVKFKFFHKTLQVHHSDTGAIEEISMARQVSLTREEYEPFISVKGWWAWPAEPLYEQIVPAQAQRLKDGNVNLESAWSTWENVETFRMKRGEDFDEVILAIPVAVLGGKKGICKEIIEAKPAWKRMVEGIKTTGVQSIQIWFNKDYAELGMNLKDWGIETTPNLVTYASPIYSFIDMSLVMEQEDWKEDNKPKMLIYFCGSMRDADDYPNFENLACPEQANEQLITLMEQWLQDHMGYFWKNNNIEFPQGFDFSILFDAEYRDSPTPQQRLRSQYFRSNVEPSNRYTLSVPNSNLARLRTDESGYSNLFLAGDWTNFGANVGYVDGAATSGLLAGKALLAKLEREG